MVGLHHKNIVRYVTSWAEKNLDLKEKSEKNDLSIHFGDTVKSEKKKNVKIFVYI